LDVLASEGARVIMYRAADEF